MPTRTHPHLTTTSTMEIGDAVASRRTPCCRPTGPHGNGHLERRGGLEAVAAPGGRRRYRSGLFPTHHTLFSEARPRATCWARPQGPVDGGVRRVAAPPPSRGAAGERRTELLMKEYEPGRRTIAAHSAQLTEQGAGRAARPVSRLAVAGRRVSQVKS